MPGERQNVQVFGDPGFLSLAHHGGFLPHTEGEGSLKWAEEMKLACLGSLRTTGKCFSPST